MRRRISFTLVVMFLLMGISQTARGARCTGSSNCRACTTCSSCKHCNGGGGSCGVCGGGSGGGWFKWLVIGGVVVYVIGAAGSKKNNK